MHKRRRRNKRRKKERYTGVRAEIQSIVGNSVLRVFHITYITSFTVFISANGTMVLVRISGYPRIRYSTA
jgi:hypothetical protein